MPTYTYQCNKCSYSHDVFHAINARPRIKCPECGSGCKRLLGTGAGVIFRGSGFYETDYKKAGGKKAETASKDDGKGESKPAGKPETTSSPAKAAGE